MASRPGLDRRLLWAATRWWMETENIKSKRFGGKSRQQWYALWAITKALELSLRATGLYARGHDHAYDIVLSRVEHPLPRLPAAFHGFTILHLSDLHLDGMPGLTERVLRLIAGEAYDLCILTGDYRLEVHGPIEAALAAMRILVSGIDCPHGILGILGNHDSVHMVEPLEEMGVRMLINEVVDIARGNSAIRIIGTDDVHYYYTDQALHALERAREAACCLALIHSPELYDVASKHGVDLYLCGHSHGGQICLPGGIPVITHLNRGHHFFRGRWEHRAMRGFTHGGTGTSGIPVRFNTRGEVVLHRLVATRA